MIRRLLHTLLVLLVATAARAADPVGPEAYDLAELPRLRTGTMHLASSADPTGGNHDRGHFLRREGSAAVLVDTAGPGQIARIWSANPHGRLRIFFDGETTARVDMPFDALGQPGAVGPNLAGWVSTAGGGVSCWFPMPFARHCKVTVEGADQLYWQVNYWTWPAGTPVRSFTRDPVTPPAPERLPAAAGGGPVTVPPGGRRVLFDLPGPATVRRFSLVLGDPVPHSGPPPFDLLRQARLVMRWDGAAPSVDAPLLDLMAAGLGPGRLESAVVQSNGRTLELRFPMPFARRGVIELFNGDPARPLTVLPRAVVVTSRRANDGYFHARYHQAATVAGRPHLLAEVTGRGHYVGTAVTLLGKDGLTFLEGDETITADGQGLRGTGTEDWFDGAWFFRFGPYATPYAGAPMLPGGKTQVAAYRWNIGDALPFRQSLKAVLEHGPGNDAPGCTYRSVAYWYADRPQPVPAAAVPAPPPPFAEPAESGQVVELESVATEALVSQGTAEAAGDGGLPAPASGGQVLLVRSEGGESLLSLPISVKRTGLYDLTLRAMELGGGVPGEPKVDGKPAEAPDRAAVGFSQPLARTRLTAGKHTLALTWDTFLGAAVALDCLELREVGKVKGAIEAEELEARAEGGRVGVLVDDLLGGGLRSPMVVGGAVPTEAVHSGGAVLHFEPTAPSARLVLPFTVDGEGDFGLAISVASRNGPYAVQLDDRTVLPHLPDHLTGIGGRTVLGTHHLASGAHNLTLVAGPGARSLTIDFVLVAPATRGQEAEYLIAKTPSGSAVIKERFGAEPKWSGGAYVRMPQSALVLPHLLTLFAPRAGRYRITVVPARIAGGGQFALRLNGQDITAAGTVDCTGTGEALGHGTPFEARLRRGSNSLEFWNKQLGDLALDVIQLEHLGPAVPWTPILAGLAAFAVALAVLGRKRKRAA